jgi:hypothetical protein
MESRVIMGSAVMCSRAMVAVGAGPPSTASAATGFFLKLRIHPSG